MTATVVTGRSVPGPARRVLAIALVQTFHWRQVLGTSAGGVGVAMLVVVIMAGVSGTTDTDLGNYESLLIGAFCGVTAIHLPTMTQTFPFALNLGVTRRAFYLAMMLLVVVCAVVQASVVTLLAQVELATGGWGLSVEVLAFGPLRRLAALEQWGVITAVLLALSTAFVFVGAVYKRWARAGIWALLGAYVLLTVLGVLIGAQLGRLGIAGLVEAGSSFAVLAGGPLALAVVLGAAGFAVLRRTTP